MFTARWSTFTLLSLLGIVGLCAFYAGRSGAEREIARAARSRTAAKPPAESLTAGRAAKVESDAETSSMGAWEQRWHETVQRPPSPANEAAMIAALEELARTDGPRAIALASQTSNLRLRAALFRAAAKGWGAVDASAAVAWAETQSLLDSHDAIGAVLQGAAEDGAAAVRVTTALIAKNPSRELEYGNDLISALNERGQFRRAAEFAQQSSGETREGWMLTAYSRWAEFEPEAAVASASQLADPAARDAAMNSVIIGWAPTNPKSLTDFAQRNLSGEAQRAAISRALEFWADSDPVAAATWINQTTPGTMADPGIATLARSSAFITAPETAVSWATTISNPILRSETVTAIVERWATMDPARADAFVTLSPNLNGEERDLLRSRISALAALR